MTTLIVAIGAFVMCYGFYKINLAETNKGIFKGAIIVIIGMLLMISYMTYVDGIFTCGLQN